MQEPMIATKHKVDLNAPLFGFNYDTLKNTGRYPVSTTFTGSQIVAPSIALSGYSKVLSGADNLNRLDGLTSTPTDCTFIARMLLGVTSDYIYIMAVLPQTSPTPFQLRIGNAGFGDRLQYAFNPNILAGVWNAPGARSIYTTAWHHVVVVRKNNVIKLFINGVQITVANGSGTSYTNATVTDGTSLGNMKGMMIGNAGTFIAEWAMYDSAKYDAPFTPPVGYLV